jgi:hypothetical protein
MNTATRFLTRVARRAGRSRWLLLLLSSAGLVVVLLMAPVLGLGVVMAIVTIRVGMIIYVNRLLRSFAVQGAA